jgi:hypothetical protein
MRLLSIVFVLFKLGFLISCSAIYDVSYDYDRDTDFTSLKSYRWLPIPEKSEINSLDLIRIKVAVDAELEKKGLKKVLKKPDFLIAYHWGTKDKVDVRPWGYGYGRFGRYWGGHWGHAGVSVYQYEEGTLIIDFVESNSKNLLWRGAAKSDVDDVKTPEKRDKVINESVQNIMKNFPPIK